MAIPIFILSIMLEAAWCHYKKKKLYRLNDAVNDLSCGIFEQIVNIFTKGFIFYNFYAVSKALALTHWSQTSWIAFLITFLLGDLAYYWYHRCAHRVKAIWATHIVHHQSEEYNLAVALRQGAFSNFFSSLFYIPLAILGADPVHFAIGHSLNLIYQFFIHTQLINRCPALIEMVMNTPSHHRVHHGKNKQYIDKNYAGVFIIWDRLFGSFEEEKEEVQYGITTPLRSFNPIWANLHYWVEISQMASATKGVLNKIWILISPPDYLPEGYVHSKEEPTLQKQDVKSHDPQISGRDQIYVFLNGLLILVGTFIYLGIQPSLGIIWTASFAVILVVSLWSLSTLVDRKSYAWKIEKLRIAALAVIFPIYTGMVI